MTQWAIYDIYAPNNADYSDGIDLSEMTDETGTAIDLTGASAAMMVRRTANSTTADISLTSETDGGITIDATNGEIYFTLSETALSALADGYKGVYDMVLTMADATKIKLIGGAFNLVSGVTHD